MSRRILVIEDDENVLEVIQLLLSQAGYQVFTSATGKDIFDLIHDCQPHVILLDILLGELNGRDLCKAVKSHPETCHIPVIIVSSLQNIYNTIADEGANDIIAKPFTEEILLARVQRQLPTAC
jgi:DNA-binding response OmpR family regulator